MMRSASVSRRLTQSERANVRRWLRRIKELVRAGRRDDHANYLVRGDDDLCEAIVDYTSLAEYGWTWPGEERLARALNESDRNIRKRIARLRAVGFLIVIAPGKGWRSNRYVPVLDGRPIFEVAATPRDAIAALRRDGCGDTGTPVPPQNTAKTGTPVPPEEERAFQQGRNASSAESSRKNPSEGDSPTPHSAALNAPPREGETLDLDLQEVSSTTQLEPTPSGSTMRTEKPTPPNGCPRDDEPEIRAEPDRAEQPAAPVVEFSFGRLMRDYPHPPGDRGIEHQAYRPHARTAWSKLTGVQKQDAARAAPNAPGKQWLGHWLNDGRETGKFEVVEQRAIMPRVWVQEGTPQWAAWVDYYRVIGRRPQTTQHRVDGELQTGWMFASEWPSALENAERVGGVQ